MLRRLCLALAILAVCAPLRAPVYAQRDDHSLSEAEVEQLREAADTPRERVLIFVKLLDDRANALHDLFTNPRHPGREQDAHDLLEQFTSIANELEDNLDDYTTHHSDIRKSLPKLLQATDRWASNLKSPPDDEAYNVSRKLALESIRDIHQDTTELIESQRAWFAAHPPPKENKNDAIDIPR
jgi:hypothetical protein